MRSKLLLLSLGVILLCCLRIQPIQDEGLTPYVLERLNTLKEPSANITIPVSTVPLRCDNQAGRMPSWCHAVCQVIGALIGL